VVRDSLGDRAFRHNIDARSADRDAHRTQVSNRMVDRYHDPF